MTAMVFDTFRMCLLRAAYKKTTGEVTELYVKYYFLTELHSQFANHKTPLSYLYTFAADVNVFCFLHLSWNIWLLSQQTW